MRLQYYKNKQMIKLQLSIKTMNFYIITQTKKYLNIISIIIKNLNYLVFKRSLDYNNLKFYRIKI